MRLHHLLLAACAARPAGAIVGRLLGRRKTQGDILRADILTRNILVQRAELAQLEKRLSGELESPSVASTLSKLKPRIHGGNFVAALRESSDVFFRRYNRQDDRVNWMSNKTRAALGITATLVTLPHAQRMARLATIRKHAPLLVVHAPGILARLDKLERFVPGILEKILDGGYLTDIEPELDGILDRFDDIEPHLPWVLENIDDLAPYVSSLMRHIDELLLFADDEYKWADDFLPYLPFFVSRLDALGPHLPLLRPHLQVLAPQFRRLVPCVDPILLGSQSYAISANADVLLFWFGWALKIPVVVPLVVRFPGGARFVAFLAKRLPRRWARGPCFDVECLVAEDYGSAWNKPFSVDPDEEERRLEKMRVDRKLGLFSLDWNPFAEATPSEKRQRAEKDKMSRMMGLRGFYL